MSRATQFNDQAQDLGLVRKKLTALLIDKPEQRYGGSDLANLTLALAKICEVEQTAVKLSNPATAGVG